MAVLDEFKSGREKTQDIYEESLLGLIATSGLLDRTAERFLKPYGLSRQQFNIMMMLKYDGGGLKQVDISSRMIVTASNISLILDTLQKKGIVKRKKKDRRTNLVSLTKRGIQRLNDVEEAYHREIKKIMGVMTTREHTVLVQILEKLRHSLLSES